MQKGSKQTEEAKRKISATKIGKKASAEHRAAISIGIKRAWERRRALKQEQSSVTG